MLSVAYSLGLFFKYRRNYFDAGKSNEFVFTLLVNLISI